MGLVDSFIRSVGSLTIVDDFDDFYSSSNDNATFVDRRKPHTVSGIPTRAAHRDQHQQHLSQQQRRAPSPPPPATHDDLRRENRALRARQDKLEKEVSRARRHVEHYKERRKEVEQLRKRLEERVKELEVTVDNLRESYQNELDDVRGQLEAAASPQKAVTVSQQEVAVAATVITVEERSRTQTPFPPSEPRSHPDADLLRQLEEKNEELRALRTYLDGSDELSMVEVVDMVRDLNSEIGALAACVVDSIVFIKTFDFEQAFALEVAEPHLAECLEILMGGISVDYSADPTLVQLAFQGWLVRCCMAVFTRFCFGLSDEEDEVLTRIFERVQQKESQAVAARWRVLARSNVRSVTNHSALQLSTSDDPFELSSAQECKILERRILSGLERIAMFAGARNPRGAFTAILAETFGPRITSLINSASQIATTLSERFISLRLSVVVEDTGKPFDPLQMESVDGDRFLAELFHSKEDDDDRAKRDVGAKVITTVGFGLLSTKKGLRKQAPWEREDQGNSSSSSGETARHVRNQTFRELAMKPKVLLSSTVRTMQANMAS